MRQPLDWGEYLSFAQALDPLVGAATIRAAVSRAYYAAYGRACLRLRRRRIALPPRDKHTFVWGEYEDIPDSDGDDVGKIGFGLKNRRVHADYYETPPMRKSDMEIALRDAAALIRAIDDLLRLGK